MNTMDGFVLNSSRGVFLGIMQLPGMLCGIWSNDPLIHVKPEAAVVFPTADVAHRFADQFEPPPEGLEIVPCVADVCLEGMWWATPAAVTRAGLKPWLLVDSETTNTLPI